MIGDKKTEMIISVDEDGLTTRIIDACKIVSMVFIKGTADYDDPKLELKLDGGHIESFKGNQAKKIYDFLKNIIYKKFEKSGIKEDYHQEL